MIDAQWFLFIVASTLVIVTPGQDMILVISRSLTHGVRAGLATAAGVSIGLVGHTLLAAAGLGAVLRTSEWLFAAVKLLGAAYLVYLGAQLLLTRGTSFEGQASATQSHMRLFLAGAASNISNPKIAVFYFAFLPQFIPHDAAHPTSIVVALGLVFAALTFVIKGPVAVFAGRLSTWFQSRPTALVRLYRFSGFVMLALACRLALSRRGDA